MQTQVDVTAMLRIFPWTMLHFLTLKDQPRVEILGSDIIGMQSLLVNIISPPWGLGEENIAFSGNKKDKNEMITYDANHTSWGNC